jgi:hypothetical protein
MPVARWEGMNWRAHRAQVLSRGTEVIVLPLPFVCLLS